MEKPQDCIVHFRTSQTIKLRVLMDTLHPILGDANLHFDSKGINMTTVSDVMVVQLHLDHFEEYNCNGKYTVGVNFQELHNCLKRATTHDTVVFQLTVAQFQSIHPTYTLFIINDEEDTIYQFSIRMLHIEALTQVLPASVFQTFIDLPSTKFLRILRCCEEQGDKIRILSKRNPVTNTNYCYFITDGDLKSVQIRVAFDMNKTDVDRGTSSTARQHDMIVCKFCGDCPNRDFYALKYLTQIAKATNMSKNVRIYLAQCEFLTIRYSIGTLGTVTFSVAGNPDDQDREDMMRYMEEDKKTPDDGGKEVKDGEPKKDSLSKQSAASATTPHQITFGMEGDLNTINVPRGFHDLWKSLNTRHNCVDDSFQPVFVTTVAKPPQPNARRRKPEAKEVVKMEPDAKRPRKATKDPKQPTLDTQFTANATTTISTPASAPAPAPIPTPPVTPSVGTPPVTMPIPKSQARRPSTAFKRRRAGNTGNGIRAPPTMTGFTVWTPPQITKNV